jgi:2-hydroxy-3-keto-5-methylthiopentenyl-1-phosphate phosphatase
VSGAGSAMRRWSVLCDFDGTISLQDVTDSLLLRFARPGWRELEQAWSEGRIGSQDCMAGQVALLDCSRDELDAHIDGMAIDPAFARFVARLQRDGVPLWILSDGLDHVIRSMLRRAGIGGVPIVASHLVQVNTRSWALEFPHARKSCTSASATCKCAWARAAEPHPVLMIGDGASDVCVAGKATLTFARDRLLEHCVEVGLPHRAVGDFETALRAWDSLFSAASPGRADVEMEAIDARD